MRSSYLLAPRSSAPVRMPVRAPCLLIVLVTGGAVACGESAPTEPPPPAPVAAFFDITRDSVMLREHRSLVLSGTARDAAGVVLDALPTWWTLQTRVASVSPEGVVRTGTAGRAWVYGAVDGIRDSVLVDVRIVFRMVSAGSFHACGTTDEGSGYCWGRNHLGQLGDGTNVSRTQPTRVVSSVRFDRIIAGHALSCGLSAGQAFCWGNNGSGQLGSGEKRHRWEPVPVYGGLSFHELAVNTYHACGISGAAEVPDEAQGYCWGGDWSGQVGDGDSRAPFEPRAVDGDLRFRSIDAGQAFSCGTTFDGTTQCWGENEWGQLGRTDAPERCITAGGGDVPCSLVPVPISGAPSLETVVTGSTHACGLTADGAAFCWGDNRAGQLGIGASDDSALPTAVVGGHRFVSLSAGHAHTCGLDAEGIAYCWGANDDGALGTMENVEQCGTGACSREPVAVAGGALRFRSISASRGPGGSHSCGVSRDGEAYCWGSNADGQLGTGIHGGHAEPVLVRLQLPLERRTGEGLPAGTP